MLGEEEMPTDRLKKVNKYSYKVITTSIENVNKDKRIC